MWFAFGNWIYQLVHAGFRLVSYFSNRTAVPLFSSIKLILKSHKIPIIHCQHLVDTVVTLAGPIGLFMSTLAWMGRWAQLVLLQGTKSRRPTRIVIFSTQGLTGSTHQVLPRAQLPPLQHLDLGQPHHQGHMVTPAPPFAKGHLHSQMFQRFPGSPWIIPIRTGALNYFMTIDFV